MVIEGRRHGSSDLLAPFLGWPFRELLVLLQEGEGARARRKAWQEGGNSVVRELLTTQLRSARGASDPQLSAPQPLPRMIPAVFLLLLLLVEQAGERFDEGR